MVTSSANDTVGCQPDVEVFANRMGLPGRHHVVVGLVDLQHSPYRVDIVTGESPVAIGVQVSQR